ncbi:MAG: hypothetical protein JWQ81_8345 [Amycolatopsis sp.]|jgi:hypothetical protein|uniref:hypothetical protein n=1 Tax=Amycolatopsis sp. TaxID=37632 RepID=UPI002632C59C|nr:hypothetical protein [Amycolatopsis sp.]MCU1687606.1 hypothetical protein [Amycolatopsis sp.]
MSWNDFYRRREVMGTVLDRARRNPAGELPFAGIPGAEELFGTEESLLLALQYKWNQLLSGQLRAESACPDDARAEAGELDQVDAVSRAWQKTTSANETLRAVLDAHADRYPSLHSVHQAELRMLAVTAGMAEQSEPTADITKIGVVLDALLRHGPARPARRRSPVSHLLRMLAPSA